MKFSTKGSCDAMALHKLNTLELRHSSLPIFLPYFFGVHWQNSPGRGFGLWHRQAFAKYFASVLPEFLLIGIAEHGALQGGGVNGRTAAIRGMVPNRHLDVAQISCKIWKIKSLGVPSHCRIDIPELKYKYKFC